MTRSEPIPCSLLLPPRPLESVLSDSPAVLENSDINRAEQEKWAVAFCQAGASLRLSGPEIDFEATRIFERHIAGESSLAGRDALNNREFGPSVCPDKFGCPFVAPLPQQEEYPC
jgi:hypothetical protein